ncbi:unnamed protein product [Dibothriocephalus latus]|uniref:Uncharacterized protein n=1 Tax=Dibothriocephalus latus TaxID=60516 RepID=A0A3P6SNZ2_DIBLA|nr:unnamed protein product [Dibothriocephalus latus]
MMQLGIKCYFSDGVRAHEKPLASDRGFYKLKPLENPPARADDKEFSPDQLDQSDFEKPTPSLPLTNNEKALNETSKGLNNQIHELIELEFQPKGGRSTPNQKSATMQFPMRTKSPQARSEIQMDDRLDGEIEHRAKQRLRGHPFRWSTLENRVRSNAFHIIRRSDLVALPNATSSGGVSAVDTGGVQPDSKQPQIPSDTTQQQVDKDMQAVDPFLFLKLNDLRIRMFIRENIGCAPLWIFSAKQLTSLRKIAMMQLISTQERLAGPTRLLKW